MTQNRFETVKKHRLEINNREEATVSGVEEVISFDESCVVLRTVCGILSLDGKDMRVVNLNADSGEVNISGVIDGAIYPENAQKGGLFFRRKSK